MNAMDRSGEAAGAAADALSPRVLCDVPGCTVHFSVCLGSGYVDVYKYKKMHLKPRQVGSG